MGTKDERTKSAVIRYGTPKVVVDVDNPPALGWTHTAHADFNFRKRESQLTIMSGTTVQHLVRLQPRAGTTKRFDPQWVALEFAYRAMRYGVTEIGTEWFYYELINHVLHDAEACLRGRRLPDTKLLKQFMDRVITDPLTAKQRVPVLTLVENRTAKSGVPTTRSRGPRFERTCVLCVLGYTRDGGHSIERHSQATSDEIRAKRDYIEQCLGFVAAYRERERILELIQRLYDNA